MGDLLLFVSFLGMQIVWWYYWQEIHLFHSQEKDWNEHLSRSFGMTGSLYAAMAFLPITRNSWFNKMLGVSFEGMLNYHIWIGYGFFLCSFFHVVFYLDYWVKSDEYDVWKSFIFADLPYEYIQNNPGMFAVICFAFGFFSLLFCVAFTAACTGNYPLV